MKSEPFTRIFSLEFPLTNLVGYLLRTFPQSKSDPFLLEEEWTVGGVIDFPCVHTLTVKWP